MTRRPAHDQDTRLVGLVVCYLWLGLVQLTLEQCGAGDLDELRPRVVAWKVEMWWFEEAFFCTLKLPSRVAGGDGPPSGQRWHDISPIYQKTQNRGTFPLIFIVSLSYRGKK